MKIRPLKAEVLAYGHTNGRWDRHDKANSSLSPICERA